MQKVVLLGFFKSVKSDRVIRNFLKRMDHDSVTTTLDLLEECDEETKNRWIQAFNQTMSK